MTKDHYNPEERKHYKCHCLVNKIFQNCYKKALGDYNLIQKPELEILTKVEYKGNDVGGKYIYEEGRIEISSKFILQNKWSQIKSVEDNNDANPRPCRFNNVEEYIKYTICHELAHYINYSIHSDNIELARGHGGKFNDILNKLLT